MGSGYGIHRDVYLETTGTACVTEIRARSREAEGACQVGVKVDAPASAALAAVIDILPENFEGKAYTLTVDRLETGPGGATVMVPMPEARTWSPDTPHLYRCRVTLKEGGTVLDVRDVLFGWRSFTIVSPEHPMEGHQEGRMVLNGKPILLRGTNITGLNALWYWGETDKIVTLMLMLKASGYNGVRSCQHVQFPEVLELADRLGILSEQDLGGAYPNHGPQCFEGLKAGAPVLARVTYNNHSVILHCYSNETSFDPKELVELTLAVDPDRVITPISGHPWQVVGDPAKGRTGYPTLTDAQWNRVIDDVHSYQGWYGNPGEPWKWTLVYPEEDRMVTIGEYGGEAIDGYETMLTYPERWGPTPPREAGGIRGNIQTSTTEIKQAIGFRQDRMPQTLEENIRASQTVQADILMEVTKGWRLSKRVGGYFQFHFVDVSAATWPKSIVSHDLRPKRGYFAMAQMNQPILAVPVIGMNPKAMTLWLDNDTDLPRTGTVLEWKVTVDGKKVLDGRETADLPAWTSLEVKEVDLAPLAKVPVATVHLELRDDTGGLLCRYEQEFHLRAYRQLFWPDGEKYRRNERNRRAQAWEAARKNHGPDATLKQAKQAYLELFRSVQQESDKKGREQAEGIYK
jgi:hypothetical protein